jgi:glycerol-3-phosphate dehydrogenase
MQLSRKHEIDVDRANAHLSIFGGKLTDCVNVGNEVSEIAPSSASSCRTRYRGTASRIARSMRSTCTRRG